jgi:hypothetical protein
MLEGMEGKTLIMKKKIKGVKVKEKMIKSK